MKCLFHFGVICSDLLTGTLCSRPTASGIISSHFHSPGHCIQDSFSREGQSDWLIWILCQPLVKEGCFTSIHRPKTASSEKEIKQNWSLVREKRNDPWTGINQRYLQQKVTKRFHQVSFKRSSSIQVTQHPRVHNRMQEVGSHDLSHKIN